MSRLLVWLSYNCAKGEKEIVEMFRVHVFAAPRGCLISARMDVLSKCRRPSRYIVCPMNVIFVLIFRMSQGNRNIEIPHSRHFSFCHGFYVSNLRHVKSRLAVANEFCVK